MDINKAQKIVVKIGSALLADLGDNPESRQWLDSLVDDIVALREKGKKVVIVTSGSVALGRKYLKTSGKMLKLEEKQAAAACGQVELMRYYQASFGRYNIAAAQILLTVHDSETRRRYLNARATMETLLQQGIVPIVNENDTVATAGLRFGDNDRLSARMAQMIAGEVVVVLSDIDGLYTANPKIDPNAVLLPEIYEITPEIEAMAAGAISSVGTGGMATKIAAAKLALESGCHMVITAGKPDHPIKRLQEGGRATWFISQKSPAKAWKNWISGTLHPAGEIIIDDGALEALKQNKSLLPAGVKEVRGNFQRGDAVIIRTLDGKEVGRGLIAYSASNTQLIKGRHSKEIEKILGFSGRDELIPRDDLVVTVK